MKNFDGAVEDFTTVIELNPNNADAFHSRGLIRLNQRSYYEAIADFDQAIVLNPKFQLAFLNRMEAKESIGDIGGACEDAKKAKKLGYKTEEHLAWIKEKCSSGGWFN